MTAIFEYSSLSIFIDSSPSSSSRASDFRFLFISSSWVCRLRIVSQFLVDFRDMRSFSATAWDKRVWRIREDRSAPWARSSRSSILLWTQKYSKLLVYRFLPENHVLASRSEASSIRALFSVIPCHCSAAERVTRTRWSPKKYFH